MNEASKISQKQVDFLNWELGGFFHFGIRTFNDGHKDWDGVPMTLESFNPTELDCDSWIKTIKQAGMTYAILVCKHHDGFANWPSKYTNYSVEYTPWKDGKGDVVREFTDACRKHGIKTGLYYSPAEFGSKDKEAKEYDDYFINQISELLTNYGKIDYLWFDGNGSESHKYDTNRIVSEIRRMQPDILLFNMWDPDTRWVGNESGVAPMPNSNFVSSLDFSVSTDRKDMLDEICFLPAECDCRMRLANWFYSDTDEHTVKDVDELMGLYYYSVGRNSNLLINIGPNPKGLLPKKDTENLLAFGEEIRRRFSSPISSSFSRHGNSFFLEFDEPAKVNHAVLSENLFEPNLIQNYCIKAYPYSYGDPIVVYISNTIGHKAICQFPTILTKKLEVQVTGNVPVNLNGFKAFYVK